MKVYQQDEESWDDDENVEETKPATDAESFAAFMDNDAADDDDGQANQGFHVGQKVNGRVSAIHPQSVLIELGTKYFGALESRDVVDENGEIPFAIGDTVSVYITAVQGNDIQISQRLSQKNQGRELLKEAYAAQTPISGKVVGENKGGFDVDIGASRGFCPVSQMDITFVEDKKIYMGLKYDFVITKYDENGRNIVLSRSILLRREEAKKIDALLAQGIDDRIYDARVIDIREFGVFVDIGSLNGLVHISEMSHGRVNSPHDLVSMGDSVKVKLTKIDRSNDKPKLSFSMKAAEVDPWTTVVKDFKPEETYEGKIVRLMNFGAFVELKPGLEGLIHISELAWGKRVRHPSDVVSVNDIVRVTIQTIDLEGRRVALTMKAIEDDPWRLFMRKHKVGDSLTAPVEVLKHFGALLTLTDGVSGLLPISVIKQVYGQAYRKTCAPGANLAVIVNAVDEGSQKVSLSLADAETDEEGRADFMAYVNEKTKESVVQKDRGSFGDLLFAKFNEKS